MTEKCCDCVNSLPNLNAGSYRGQWMGDSTSALDATLPEKMRTTLGRFVGVEELETLGEWATEVRKRTGGGAITVEDLCHAGAETPYWGDVDGERYHFLCFYDAVILAALANQPVDIHTESPDEEVIEAHALGSDQLRVSPNTAVFSFGIDPSRAPPPAEQPTLEDGYAAICPYVQAFPDRDAYERWAREVAAPTVALPLDGATELAARLVE